MAENTIGFIGQGFIGKNYADDFERRGFRVLRYAKEAPHNSEAHKHAIGTSPITFIAVPTPTTPQGYDPSILRTVISLTQPGSIVVIKSTVLPGMTKQFQNEFPDRIIMHSPEFLREVTAKEDAAHPFMNIVGITENTLEHRQAAEKVLSMLAIAPYNKIVSSDEAELIKYAHNCAGVMQIIFFNMMYDLSQSLGADWKSVEDSLRADPFIAHHYISPIHKTGRGAGGHCFIKDFAAFREVYEKMVGDPEGLAILKATETKNRSLLTQSKKDLDLLYGVYGK